MNLKLTNEERNVEKVLDENNKQEKVLTVKEERQRTGRYIAILVGILLFLLAMYHAWVRKIPVIASLVVPAIIMFVYVGWVLYTASRDKHRALDLEAALQAAADAEAEDNADNTSSVFVISQTEEYIHKDLTEISTAIVKASPNLGRDFIVKPIILVNDEPPDDIDQTDLPIVTVTFENYKDRDKLRDLPTKRYKRRFCRSKRNAVFKRSYSIA